MSEDQLTTFYLQLGILALFARLGGEIFRRLTAPVVLGEVVAGVILGPTLLGHLSPTIYPQLFPTSGPNAIALTAITNLAAVLFLLAAGLEVDLAQVYRQGRSALAVSLAGVLVPLATGFLLAFHFPQLLGQHPDEHLTIFAMFTGVALSITALPILAKTLLDLNQFRTPFGMTLIAAGVLDDLIGWILFGIVLALDHIHDAGAFQWGPILQMIIVTLGFAGLMVTAGRWIGERFLKFCTRFCSPNGSIIGIVLGLGLVAASFTQYIGVHGLFGAFLLGAALGESPHLQSDKREAIARVVSNFLAPLLFASVGLKVDFLAHFDLQTVLVVLAVACIGKISGAGIAAFWVGMPAAKAWAAGFGMNCRGVMEILVGMIALQEKIIDERFFVALATMAMVTSLMGGVAIRLLIGPGTEIVPNPVSSNYGKIHEPEKFTDSHHDSKTEGVHTKVHRLSGMWHSPPPGNLS